MRLPGSMVGVRALVKQTGVTMSSDRTIYRRERQRAPATGSLAAAALLAVLLTPSAKAVETGEFQPPSLDGFTFTSEEYADGDGDGVKETRVWHYSNGRGDRLYNMTTKGVRWAWSKQSHAGAGSENNFVIRDSNCDGIYDQKYSLDEEYHVPDCLK